MLRKTDLRPTSCRSFEKKTESNGRLLFLFFYPLLDVGTLLDFPLGDFSFGGVVRPANSIHPTRRPSEGAGGEEEQEDRL